MLQLFRICADMLFISIHTIVMFTILYINISTELANMSSITYGLSLVTVIIETLIFTGVNLCKNKSKDLINSAFIISLCLGLVFEIILFTNIDKFIHFMNINSEVNYKFYLILSFSILYCKFILECKTSIKEFELKLKEARLDIIKFSLLSNLCLFITTRYLSNNVLIYIINVIVSLVVVNPFEYLSIKKFDLSWIKYLNQGVPRTIELICLAVVWFFSISFISEDKDYLLTQSIIILTTDFQWDIACSSKKSTLINLKNNKFKLKNEFLYNFILYVLLFLSSLLFVFLQSRHLKLPNIFFIIFMIEYWGIAIQLFGQILESKLIYINKVVGLSYLYILRSIVQIIMLFVMTSKYAMTERFVISNIIKLIGIFMIYLQ